MSSNGPDNNHHISDSWVDLSGQCSQSGNTSPNRITPVPFGGDQDYIRMLREAQRESNRSSTKVSPISSAIMSLSSTTRNTPNASPKSPPNSPNTELATIAEDFSGVYINQLTEGLHRRGCNQPVTASELIWDWTSRPNVPQKEWQITNSDASSRTSSKDDGRTGKSRYFSKGIIYTLLLTNIVSLLLGAGLGMWLSKRGSSGGVIEVGV